MTLAKFDTPMTVILGAGVCGPGDVGGDCGDTVVTPRIENKISAMRALAQAEFMGKLVRMDHTATSEEALL